MYTQAVPEGMPTHVRETIKGIAMSSHNIMRACWSLIRGVHRQCTDSLCRCREGAVARHAHLRDVGVGKCSPSPFRILAF